MSKTKRYIGGKKRASKGKKRASHYKNKPAITNNKSPNDTKPVSQELVANPESKSKESGQQSWFAFFTSYLPPYLRNMALSNALENWRVWFQKYIETAANNAINNAVLFGAALFSQNVISSAATQVSNILTEAITYIYHSGKAPSGSDYCADQLFGCIQGYVEAVANTTTDVVVNWFRTVNIASYGSDVKYGAILKDCLNTAAINNLFKKTLPATGNLTSLATDAASKICSADSNIWHGYIAQFSATIANNLEVDCSTIEDAFKLAAQSCESSKTIAEAYIIVIGIVAAVSLCCCCCACCTLGASATTATTISVPAAGIKLCGRKIQDFIENQMDQKESLLPK